MTQLKHGQASPNVQLCALNPKVFTAMGAKLAFTTFSVDPAKLGLGKTFLGSVSSFGYAGSLAHAVLSYDVSVTPTPPPTMKRAVHYRRLYFPVRPDAPKRDPLADLKALYGMSWQALVSDISAFSCHYTLLLPAQGASALAVDAALRATEPATPSSKRTEAVLIPLDATTGSRPSVEGMKTALMQAFKLVSSMETRLVLLTRGAHGPQLCGGSVGRAGASNGGVWGLACVTRVEMPNANVDSADVLPPATIGTIGLRALVGVLDSAQISTELASRGSMQLEVRLRKGAIVKPASIYPKAVAGAEVVITGGLGSLGLHITPWLLAHSASTVILTSRSGQVARDGQGLGAP